MNDPFESSIILTGDESKGKEVISDNHHWEFSGFQLGEGIALKNFHEVALFLEKHGIKSPYGTYLEGYLKMKKSVDRLSREEFVAINRTPIARRDFEEKDEKLERIKELRK